MSLDRFCHWLVDTPGSIALHESLYMYTLIESTHVLTLCAFVGLSVMLDLRLLGITLRRITVSEVASKLLPWMTAGFAVMVVTGILLFYANPVRFYHSIWFRLKLVMLTLAGLNAWLFHSGIWRRVADWDRDVITPPRARAAGAASLVLWAAIVVAGRLIAYNWFDCDITHSSVIVQLAGCTPTRR